MEFTAFPGWVRFDAQLRTYRTYSDVRTSHIRVGAQLRIYRVCAAGYCAAAHVRTAPGASTAPAGQLNGHGRGISILLQKAV